MTRKIGRWRKRKLGANDKAWHEAMMAQGSYIGRDNQTGAPVFAPWDHFELLQMALLSFPQPDLDLGRDIMAPDWREMRQEAKRRNAAMGFIISRLYGLPL